MWVRITLEPFLCSNIALDELLRDIASRRSKIAPRPQGRETTQYRVLLAQMMRRKTFALLDYLCRRVGRPDTHEEMDMIGLNRQLQNRPTLLSTLLLDEGLAILGDSATEHGFPSLGTPDQVVDDKVDAVFISLIIHVDIISHNNTIIYTTSGKVRLKPRSAHLYRVAGGCCHPPAP